MSEPDQHNPLSQYIVDWSPEPTEVTAELDVATARVLSDIVDFPLPHTKQLPPLWQWGYFQNWPELPGLGADGHPVHDPFQPPIPGRRRMWAGGAVELLAPLQIGRPAVRRGSVRNVVPKSGRSGHMILATVRYEYVQDGDVRIIEDQNHVYRGAPDAEPIPTWGERPSALPASDEPWQHPIASDPIRLFRMSAITANSHRIHYDVPYSREVEHYPDLVVHGPLLAMHLGVLAARTEPARTLRSFSYRVQAPVFVGEPVLAVGGPPSGEDGVSALSVISDTGTVHVTASAGYAD